jgi:DNA repair protein SbcD/Mre11
MPRLLHMADVHLGARHDDLGPAAADQRERQFGAFQRAIDLAITEKVDLILICGDLFDSNAQPRRSVERAAGELAKAVARRIPTVIIPGTHDCYDAASIYRVFDLAEMAGAEPDSALLTVMTDERPKIHFDHLDLTVVARTFATKRAPSSPLAGLASDAPGKWKVGMVHGSFAVPGRFDQDDVVFTDQEIADSGLDYLALGHWHSFREGRSGATPWAYPGAVDLVAVDQDGAGQVLLVGLEERGGRREVTLQQRRVGRSHFQRMELDAAALTSQADLERQLREHADPDRVLDVRVAGVRPDELDLNLEELERQLRGSFLRLRIRDASVPQMAGTAAQAPADTILGAFGRDLIARIDEHESRGDLATAAELREALHLGELLLDDAQRVTLA